MGTPSTCRSKGMDPGRMWPHRTLTSATSSIHTHPHPSNPIHTHPNPSTPIHTRPHPFTPTHTHTRTWVRTQAQTQTQTQTCIRTHRTMRIQPPPCLGAA
mmetsp:Transcript_36702/g.65658  ORF Transcript_36702/g.65658 Transcript_36702/m.65658 type:complete len:100 (-) Transcript_36702:244-543(-)